MNPQNNTNNMMRTDKARQESAVSIVSGVWMDALSPDKEAELIGIIDMQKMFNPNFLGQFYKATGLYFQEIEIEGTRVGNVLVTDTQHVVGKGIVPIKKIDPETEKKDMIRGGTKIGTYQRPPLNIDEIGQRLDRLATIQLDERDIQQMKDCLEGSTIEQRLVVIPPAKPSPIENMGFDATM